MEALFGSFLAICLILAVIGRAAAWKDYQVQQLGRAGFRFTLAFTVLVMMMVVLIRLS